VTFHSKSVLWPINVAGDNKINALNMKLAEIRGSRVDTCGQTDGHDESNRGCGGYANFSKINRKMSGNTRQPKSVLSPLVSGRA
jgi:hypothetical protein